MTPMHDTQAWELTFHDTDDTNVIVGVHSQDPNDAETARETFQRLGALDIRTAGPETTPGAAVSSMSRSR